MCTGEYVDKHLHARAYMAGVHDVQMRSSTAPACIGFESQILFTLAETATDMPVVVVPPPSMLETRDYRYRE